MVARTVEWTVASKVVRSVEVMAAQMVAWLENLWVAMMVEM